MKISKKFGEAARALAADIFLLVPNVFSLLAERAAGRKKAEKIQNSDINPAGARHAITYDFRVKRDITSSSSLRYGLPWNVDKLEQKTSKNELSNQAPAAAERAGCMGATTEEEVRGEKKRP